MKTIEIFFLMIHILEGLLFIAAVALIIVIFKWVKERKKINDIIVNITTDLKKNNNNVEQILQELKKEQELINEQIKKTLQ